MDQLFEMHSQHLILQDLNCASGDRCEMRRSTCDYPPCPYFPTCVRKYIFYSLYIILLIINVYLYGIFVFVYILLLSVFVFVCTLAVLTVLHIQSVC